MSITYPLEFAFIERKGSSFHEASVMRDHPTQPTRSSSRTKARRDLRDKSQAVQMGKMGTRKTKPTQDNSGIMEKNTVSYASLLKIVSCFFRIDRDHFPLATFLPCTTWMPLARFGSSKSLDQAWCCTRWSGGSEGPGQCTAGWGKVPREVMCCQLPGQ